MIVARNTPRLVVVPRRTRDVIARGVGQGPAGPSGSALTLAIWDHDGTMAHRSANRITVANVNLTTPPNPTDGEQVQFSVRQILDSTSITGNGDATVNGEATYTMETTPCSGTLEYDEDENNWFLTSFYAGQTPA